MPAALGQDGLDDEVGYLPSQVTPSPNAQGADEDDRVKAYIQQAAADPQVQAAVRSSAGSIAQDVALQARANYCVSFGHYQNELMKRPKIDIDMIMLRQRDWKRAFEYWNLRWVQATVAYLAVYMAFFTLFALSRFAILSIIGMAFNLALIGVLTTAGGHAGWYFVREQSDCCGNYGFLAMGLGYLILAYQASSYLSDRYELLKWLTIIGLLPLGYMELACWKLGCSVAARAIGQQVRGQLTARMNELQEMPRSRPPSQPQPQQQQPGQGQSPPSQHLQLPRQGPPPAAAAAPSPAPGTVDLGRQAPRP